MQRSLVEPCLLIVHKNKYLQNRCGFVRPLDVYNEQDEDPESELLEEPEKEETTQSQQPALTCNTSTGLL